MPVLCGLLVTSRYAVRCGCPLFCSLYIISHEGFYLVAPRNRDKDSSSLATTEMFTGVPPGAIGGSAAHSSSSSAVVEAVTQVPVGTMADKSRRGATSSGGSASASVVESVTQVPSGTLSEKNRRGGSSSAAIVESVTQVPSGTLSEKNPPSGGMTLTEFFTHVPPGTMEYVSVADDQDNFSWRPSPTDAQLMLYSAAVTMGLDSQRVLARSELLSSLAGVQAARTSGNPLRTGGELAAALYPDRTASNFLKTGDLKLRGFPTGISRVTPVIGILTIPLSVRENMQDQWSEEHGWQPGNSARRAVTREVVGFGSGLAASALTGAAIGSFFPGAGTVAGLAIGAGVGAVATFYGSKAADYALPEEFSSGGYVTKSGGYISGPGGPTDDLIPAWISNGEYVVNARSTRQYGALLEAINNGDSARLMEAMLPGGAGSDGSVEVPQLDVDGLLSDAAVSGLSSGISGALSGVEQHGLAGGLIGGLEGAASAAGSQIGSGIGAAIGTTVGGPVGTAIGSALGSIVGSEVVGGAAEVITKPIQFAAETAKEVIGSGFGLVDLAEGPGGHTQRGDIYNISGMDPKSVKTAVERVRRRKLVAVSRGGSVR